MGGGGVRYTSGSVDKTTNEPSLGSTGGAGAGSHLVVDPATGQATGYLSVKAPALFTFDRSGRGGFPPFGGPA